MRSARVVLAGCTTACSACSARSPAMRSDLGVSTHCTIARPSAASRTRSLLPAATEDPSRKACSIASAAARVRASSSAPSGAKRAVGKRAKPWSLRTRCCPQAELARANTAAKPKPVAAIPTGPGNSSGGWERNQSRRLPPRRCPGKLMPWLRCPGHEMRKRCCLRPKMRATWPPRAGGRAVERRRTGGRCSSTGAGWNTRTAVSGASTSM